MIRVSVYIDKEQHYRCQLANIQRY